MSYNVESLPKFVSAAGKITILTAVVGVAVFTVAFLFNAGTNELTKVEATSTASTTLTVLNTPPDWIEFAIEETESSTSSPTNSGNEIAWVGTAADSNGQPYFLIVCSSSATPTPRSNNTPVCNATTSLWAVSASTTSGTQARAATTTTEVAPYAEVNDWFAWVCDYDLVNPRCNNIASQGTSATNSSPFHVNRRPVFSDFYNDSPTIPGGVLTFYSTSSDPDSTGGDDLIVLHVCNEDDFDINTAQCGPGGTIATTSPAVTDDATAVYVLPSVIQDQPYDAFGYIVDEHGHVAIGSIQGSNEPFDVANVAPTVVADSISINGGLDISLANPAGETTGLTLDFTTSDANSCINFDDEPEMKDVIVSIFRTDIGSTTCNGTADAYNPNNCYPSGVGTSTWNLSCTSATSTTCGGATDPTVEWNCTFPLWFLADPTDDGSPFATASWTASIAAIDDNNATGSFAVGSSSTWIDILTFPALSLLTSEIAYGALEPGQPAGPLTASTTIAAVGNAGLNQEVEGESMCTTFGISTPCPFSASSTVPENRQRFATSSVAYSSGFALSSTTPFELEINVLKSTSTTLFASGITYWGIEVPGTITLAGAYTGLNTFYAVVSDPNRWE